MVRVVMKENGNLNVWADYDTMDQCYCNDAELVLMFRLKCEMYSREHKGRNFNSSHIIDFINTYRRLGDFHFDFTDQGIVYYRTTKD
jgi:hypothetical protein